MALSGDRNWGKLERLSSDRICETLRTLSSFAVPYVHTDLSKLNLATSSFSFSVHGPVVVLNKITVKIKKL